MSNNKIKFLLVPMLLFSFIIGKAQVDWIEDVSMTVPDDRMVAFISDFASFLEVKNAPIYMTSTGRIVGSVPNQEYTLVFKLYYNSAVNGNIVIEQSSKQFKLEDIGLAEGSNINFTNLVFNNGLIGPGQTQMLEWGSAIVTRPPEFSEDALGGGTLPPGAYTITADFIEIGASNDPIDYTLPFEIIEIPTFLELIYPGWEYGGEEVPVIYQEFPVFQWRPENADAFSKFRVKMYMKLDFHRSINEISQSDPIMDYEIDYTDPANPLPRGLFSLPYQQTNGKPMTFGATYVWNIEGTVPSSSGPDLVRVQSPFYIFSLRQPGGNIGSTFGAIEFLLKKIFDGDIPEKVVDDLRGVYFNGTILVNGRMITATDLNRLVNKLEEAAKNDDKAISDYVQQVKIEEK